MVAAAVIAQDHYYSRENLKAFAEHLAAMGDYDRAIGEWLRAAARTETPEGRDSLWYRIAVVCLTRAMPQEARRYCSRISPASVTLYERARCLSAYSYYSEGRYDSAALCNLTFTDTAMSLRCGNIKTASLLKQYRWKDAAEQRMIPDDSLSIMLYDVAQQGTALPQKSPFVAGAFSALLPGSGKWYAHRGRDGFVSLLIVATTAWQAYEGYRRDGPFSPRCLLFGSLGAVFYTGNIYGSVIAARQFNEAKRSTLAARVTLDFDW